MPLYEFTCRKCGHVFEELLSAAELEQGKPKCPACRSARVEKGFSAFATGGAGGGGAAVGGCGGGGGFT
jgi:putative FmdB family regulatory protein